MLLRRIARPLFASWFVSEGLDALRRPAPHAAAARAALDRAARVAGPELPTLSDKQLTLVVRAHGAACAGAGLMLATGRAPRTAALVLAVLTAPVVAANLPDRRADGRDGDLRRLRRERLVRALAFTGGAVLAAADREGRPGLQWRVAHARDQRRAVDEAVQQAIEATAS
ncbi:DoxX family membrane protein [Cellulomonas composti]|uniref:DoxX family protein n=1 Tax=Cellulomonas composti TaxID=266130 RepID=A0A511JCI6_9CELL|nr:DoxX family membrane protein [Cellulomonas composti]GEL95479.1 hypothetical protein CCO02nite_21370 [Cellulomonas composti]